MEDVKTIMGFPVIESEAMVEDRVLILGSFNEYWPIRVNLELVVVKGKFMLIRSKG